MICKEVGLHHGLHLDEDRQCSELQYWWVGYNTHKDKEERVEEIRNLIDSVHARLRPETYDFKKDKVGVSDNDFDQAVKEAIEAEKKHNVQEKKESANTK